jgi:hypothetical protein
MTRAGVSAIGVLCGLIGMCMVTPALYGADLSGYRGFQFGMTLPVVAQQAKINPSEARLLHQRPAVIQELDWLPRSPVQVEPAKNDAVKDGVLSFYNGELFQIVVSYDRYKVEGMTADDLVDAISLAYGAATRPKAEIPYHSNYGESAEVIARWEDPQYSFNLVRTGNRTSFALIMFSKRTNALAQTAIVEAARLDLLEAPQRAIDLQKKLEADDRSELDKARAVNKPNFRP